MNTFRIRIQFDDSQGHEDFIMEIKAKALWIARLKAVLGVLNMFTGTSNLKTEEA